MIFIGSDHRGIQRKRTIKMVLDTLKVEYQDIGAHDENAVDYPDIVHKMMREFGENDIGILICYTANGMAMTANKYQNIRASICWDHELAELARKHNNANILCIPAGFMDDRFVHLYAIVNNFLNTEFEGGRHQGRLNKISPFYSLKDRERKK